MFILATLLLAQVSTAKLEKAAEAAFIMGKCDSYFSAEDRAANLSRMTNTSDDKRVRELLWSMYREGIADGAPPYEVCRKVVAGLR